MFPTLIEDLLGGRPVDPSRLHEALGAVVDGGAEPAAAAGLLVALRTRPADAPTLAAAARALRERAVRVRPTVRPLIDTCGTGGDGAGTFNVSTATALVVAAAGGAVAKHGNRGVSSKVGSADVLEHLGLRLELSPREACGLLDATGFTFLHAPAFHPAMRRVAPVRRALGVATLFNLLGPLASPAASEHQLVGVHDPALTGTVARALRELGVESALVVHCDGLDELGLHAPTRGHRLREGLVHEYACDPRALGLDAAPIAALAGGDAARNAAILSSVLEGAPGPARDVVCLNAAAALMVGGLARDEREGLERARAVVDGGEAAAVLARCLRSAPRETEALA